MSDKDNKKDKKVLSEKTRRRLRFGTNAIVVAIVVVVVVLLANILLSRINMSVDLTGEALYSITDTSKKILSGLNQDVKIYALYDRIKGEGSASAAPIIKYLDIYDSYPRVSVDYINLDQNPAFLRETLGEDNAASASSGDYIVKAADHTRVISASAMYTVSYDSYTGAGAITGINAEACLTGAVQYVISEEVPVVYVSTGNGEASLNQYMHLALTIQNNNFNLKEIDLSVSDVPEDCAAILFVAPTKDLTANQLTKLKNWFNTTSGNIIALMDPTESGTDFSGFNELFRLFSLKINNDVVTETADNSLPGYTQWFRGTLENADNSPNENFQTTATMFIETRSLEALSLTTSYSDSAELAHSSIGATSTAIDTGETSTGVKTLIASGRYQGGPDISKLVLTGSSKNLSDDYYQNWDAGWTAFIMRSLNWMYENFNEGDLIPAKKLNTEILAVSQSTANTIGIICVIALPLLIMAVGFIVWLKRRNL